MQRHDFTLPFPPLQVGAGVLIVDGYGISLRVLYGKLHVEDGIGPRRRSIVLDRTGSGLERLVLLGKTGSITLEALAWTRAIGAALVHIGLDGELLTLSVPFSTGVHSMRRAQALAGTAGLGVAVARDLIDRKMGGQRVNLVRLQADLRGFDRVHAALADAKSVDDVRLYEAKAAAIYWNAWSGVSIRLRGRDLLRVPASWIRYDSRASLLTGAPRAATNPVNALLNYCYALLESESRVALLAVGLDPALGVLHADQRNRDSFALDAMEPIRPDVDAFVIDLLEGQVFSARDFVEIPNGVCRLRAPLTHTLSRTLPRWRSLMAPIVTQLAQTFREAASFGIATSQNARPLRRVGPSPSPLRSTPRASTPPPPYQRKHHTPRPEPLALVPMPCASCGTPVRRRRRRYCDACMPIARKARGRRAATAARAVLAERAAAGEDPRATVTANRARGDANAEHHRRNREWRRSHGTPPDRAWFLREITPNLDAFTLREIADATGLSLAACSRFRAGTRVPHPRHWPRFLALVDRGAH